MKKVLTILNFVFLSILSTAQIRTVTANGDWDNAGTWQAGEIADAIPEDVSFTAGEKTATVRNAFNYTVGTIALDDDGNLAIEGTLSIGDAITSKNLTAIDGSMNVSGNLTIWGDVIVSNSLNWTISGTVIVKGNVTMGDGATVTNSGNFTVDGNFTGGVGTIVTNSSTINVGGAVTVNTGSVLINSGTFNANSCSGPPGFCGGVLPVKLIYFQGHHINKENVIEWATSTETNFDRFIIQRSIDGIHYHAIGEQKGKGRDIYNIVSKYTFLDSKPLCGKNYYRLMALDLDGQFEYSDVVLVTAKGFKSITLFPNPSNGHQLNIQTNFKPSGNAVIEIFDNLGLKLKESSVTDFESKVEFSYDLKPGTYFLQYTSTDYSEIIRFFVK